ncbi:MAG: SCO4226 family nickel-binding protein [Anaeromyxobacter sp.]
MARFMDVHSSMKGVTREALLEAHNRDLALEGKEKVHFIEAWADPTSGKVFCLAEGPNKEAVQRVHQQAGHPAEEIYEVALNVK